LVKKYVLLTKLQGFYEKIQKNKLTQLIQTRAYFFMNFFGPEKGRLLMLLILFE
jgi:hypothetical protein